MFNVNFSLPQNVEVCGHKLQSPLPFAWNSLEESIWESHMINFGLRKNNIALLRHIFASSTWSY
jgi:hypothetical protein